MKANCPICDTSLKLSADLIESEVFECVDCHRKIVVKSIGKKIELEEAPGVEEDWGE
ncbi:sulfonate ABC transporter [Candidatus Gottesmanbacteria bacterium]|nr:sulfonate ABC transporter [Candidatus Gottesmanbacteria bacterium]